MNGLFYWLALAAIAWAGPHLAPPAADPPTAAEVVARIRTHVNAPWSAETVDTFKAGDPDAPVTGIATTFMPTQDVLERAVAANCNLIITHEPTFYTHYDDPEDLEPDAVLDAKRAYIERHGLVIWRFHDHVHRHAPDLIDAGMVEAMGLDAYRVGDEPVLFRLPETTVGALAQRLKARLGARSVDVVGDPRMTVTRAGFAAGAPSSLTQLALLQRDDVEVLVAGETREWETVPYVQDAAAQGRRKAMILLGHVNSEEGGMRRVARWLRGFVEEVPVTFIPAGDPFVDVGDPEP